MIFVHDTPTNRLLNMVLGAMAGGKTVEDTATGNPLTFQTDLARPLKSLLIPFTPVQSGTGDPSPQNIRNILPWNGLKVDHISENLWKNRKNNEKQSFTRCIKVTLSQTLPAGTYTFTATVESETTGTECAVGFSKGNNNIIATVKLPKSGRHSATFTVNDTVDTVYMYADIDYAPSAGLTATYSGIMIEAGTKAPTETDISFPSPVYGGEHEAVSGKLMDGWKVVDMGSLEWTYRSGDDNFTAPTPSDAFDMVSSADIVNNFSCEAYKGVFSFVGNNVITMNNRSTGLTKLIRVRDQSFGEDAEAFTAFVTGKKLAYKLATPQEITLTPEQITALVGDNTIWSDADGSMTATYLKKG